MGRYRFQYLLLLVNLLVWPLVAFTASPEASGDGATRLTTGANLLSLEAWPGGGQFVGVTAGPAPVRMAVDVPNATLTPTEQAVESQVAQRLAVSVEGVTHRLDLDGQTLVATDDEILGRPALSPDGSWLVVARYPRGTETASLGELWRYDLNAQQWTALTSNGVEEIDPVISADGQQVAFLRDGDIWAIPADRTTAEPLVASPTEDAPMAITSHTPPATIRVMHGSANTCRRVPVGQIDVIPFEEYVKRVTPHESPPSWHPEALKAQAIAARTYAWLKVLYPAGPNYDVEDTTRHQYMCDTTNPNTDAAVDATRGQHLTYNGAIINSMYSAENASATLQNTYGARYLDAINDPVSFGFRRNGHGQGYSQWGGKRWADIGWSYISILRHYYSDAVVEPPAGSSLTLLDVANRPTSPYLRGSALRLELNASNVTGTRAREWKPDAGGTLRESPWQDDMSGSDGWHHLFPLLGLPDLAERNYRIELNAYPDVISWSRPVLYLGIDRAPPTLAVTATPDAAHTNVRLRFQASDATSGMERIGWSHQPWQQEAETIGGGLVYNDATASGGRALRLEPGMTSAPHTLTFPRIAVEPGKYRVWFRLRTTTIANRNAVATLRLFDDAATPLQRGVRYLYGADFPSSNWEWFFVDIDATTNYGGRASASVQPRIEWRGAQPLYVDRLFLATRPDTIPAETTVAMAPPSSTIIYASDNAGNVRLVSCTAYAARASAVDTLLALAQNYRIYLPIVPQSTRGAYECVPDL